MKGLRKTKKRANRQTRKTMYRRRYKKRTFIRSKRKYKKRTQRGAAESTSIKPYYEKTKYISGHGLILAGYTFELPSNVSVITVSNCNTTASDFEITDDASGYLIQNVIRDIYITGNSTLFKSNDTNCKALSPRAKTVLRDYKTAVKIYKKLFCSFAVRLHLPGTTVNNMILQLSGEDCDDYGFCQGSYIDDSQFIPLEGIMDNLTDGTTTNLQKLIEKYGPGVYIIAACRNFHSEEEPGAQLSRELSSSNPCPRFDWAGRPVEPGSEISLEDFKTTEARTGPLSEGARKMICKYFTGDVEKHKQRESERFGIFLGDKVIKYIEHYLVMRDKRGIPEYGIRLRNGRIIPIKSPDFDEIATNPSSIISQLSVPDQNDIMKEFKQNDEYDFGVELSRNISKNYINDLETAKMMAEIDGLYTLGIHKKLKNNAEVVRIAVIQNAKAFRYVDRELKSDFGFLREIFQDTFKDIFERDDDAVAVAVAVDETRALNLNLPTTLNDKEKLLAITLSYYPDWFRSNKQEVGMLITTCGPSVIFGTIGDMLSDKQVVWLLCKQDPEYFAYADYDDLKSDRAYVEYLVEDTELTWEKVEKIIKYRYDNVCIDNNY